MNPPTRIKQYKLTEIIHKSLYSYIFRAIDPTSSKKYVAKVIDISKTTQTQIEIETFIMEKFKYKYIMKTLKAFDVTGFKILLMKMTNLGDLYQVVKENYITSLECCAQLMFRILLAVKYLHLKKVLHGDIKPENILINIKNKNELKPILTDFGFSTILTDSNYCFCDKGTPFYSSPELLNHKPHSFPSDIWSLGATFYFLLTKQILYQNISIECLLLTIYTKKPNYNIGYFLQSSTNLYQLIDSMLCTDPNQRITLDQCLNSPFFLQNLGKEWIEKEINESPKYRKRSIEGISDSKYHV